MIVHRSLLFLRAYAMQGFGAMGWDTAQELQESNLRHHYSDTGLLGPCISWIAQSVAYLDQIRLANILIFS